MVWHTKHGEAISFILQMVTWWRMNEEAMYLVLLHAQYIANWALPLLPVSLLDAKCLKMASLD